LNKAVFHSKVIILINESTESGDHKLFSKGQTAVFILDHLLHNLDCNLSPQFLIKAMVFIFFYSSVSQFFAPFMHLPFCIPNMGKHSIQSTVSVN